MAGDWIPRRSEVAIISVQVKKYFLTTDEHPPPHPSLRFTNILRACMLKAMIVSLKPSARENGAGAIFNVVGRQSEKRSKKAKSYREGELFELLRI